MNQINEYVALTLILLASVIAGSIIYLSAKEPVLTGSNSVIAPHWVRLNCCGLPPYDTN